jgi:outer membrane protein W
MKKMMFASALTLLAVVTKAQTQEGDWLIGGNLNFSAAKQNTQFGIDPDAGYFFADNFAAGASIGFNYVKLGDTKYTAFSAGPFARYYAGNMEKPFRPFLHTEIKFGTQKTTGESSASSTAFYLAPGASYFINKNVAVEALAGYQNSKVKGSSSSGGFLLKVGFQIYLSKRQVRELRKKM